MKRNLRLKNGGGGIYLIPDFCSVIILTCRFTPLKYSCVTLHTHRNLTIVELIHSRHFPSTMNDVVHKIDAYTYIRATTHDLTIPYSSRSHKSTFVACSRL